MLSMLRLRREYLKLDRKEGHMLIFELANSFSAASRLLNRFTAGNAAIVKMAAGSKELQDACANIAYASANFIFN